jgi:hypothetical protein
MLEFGGMVAKRFFISMVKRTTEALGKTDGKAAKSLWRQQSLSDR